MAETTKITPEFYDERVYINDELSGIRKDSAWGIVRLADGSVLLDFEYAGINIVTENLLYVISKSKDDLQKEEKIYYGYSGGRLFPVTYNYCLSYKKVRLVRRHRGQEYPYLTNAIEDNISIRKMVFGGYDEYERKKGKWEFEKMLAHITRGDYKETMERMPEKSDYIPEHVYLVNGQELVFKQEINEIGSLMKTVLRLLKWE